MRKPSPKDKLVNKLSFVIVYTTPKLKKVREMHVNVRVEPGSYYEQPGRCILAAEQHAIEKAVKLGRIVNCSYSV